MKILSHTYKIIILLLSFILIINIVLAAENETIEDMNITEEYNLTEEAFVEEIIEEPLAEEVQEEIIDTCGNNLIDAGETCVSCPQDVRCKSGEICDLNTGLCTKKSDLMLYTVLGFLFIIILGFVIFRATRKKKTEEPKEAVPIQPVQPSPTQGTIQAAAEQNKVQPKPIDNKAIQKPQEVKPVEKPKPISAKKIPVEQPKAIPENELQSYIQQMRAKGIDDETIRQKLRKQGWKDNKVAIAFLTMKKK